jgi:hypothetical protein
VAEFGNMEKERNLQRRRRNEKQKKKSLKRRRGLSTCYMILSPMSRTRKG